MLHSILQAMANPASSAIILLGVLIATVAGIIPAYREQRRRLKLSRSARLQPCLRHSGAGLLDIDQAFSKLVFTSRSTIFDLWVYNDGLAEAKNVSVRVKLNGKELDDANSAALQRGFPPNATIPPGGSLMALQVYPDANNPADVEVEVKWQDLDRAGKCERRMLQGWRHRFVPTEALAAEPYLHQPGDVPR